MLTQVHRRPRWIVTAALPRLALCSMLLALGACATFTPVPLPETALESKTDHTIITAAAAALTHPRLHPVVVDFSQPLTLEMIQTIAVVANPQLRAERARAGVADAQVFAAGLLPDPTFSVGFDPPIDPAGLVTGGTAGVALEVMNPLKRKTEVEAAKHAAEQIRLDIAWLEWTTALQAKLSAVRQQSLQRIAILVAAARQLAQQAFDRTQRAVVHGDLSAQQLMAARIALNEITQRALSADTEAQAARLELNELLGLAPDELITLAPNTEAVALPDLDRLYHEAVNRRLDLAALRAGYASQEATLHSAVLGQFPSITLSLNGARDTSAIDTLGPSLAFSVPLWNRNRGAIRVADADAVRLQDEYTARLFGTRAELAKHTAALRLLVRQRIEQLALLDALASDLKKYQDAANQGDIARSVAETIQSAMLDKQIVVETLTQTINEETVAVEAAVGAPLDTLQ